ncbi:MAG: hypothetical protein GY835_16925 [bacterium]|nr:hypothetical protein [bacterium]
MSEHVLMLQTSLFPVADVKSEGRAGKLVTIPRVDSGEVGLAEAVANAARNSATPGDPERHWRERLENGGSRKANAHLPGKSGDPEIYALCPGCEVHPEGGIYSAAELAGAEGCPVGSRLNTVIDAPCSEPVVSGLEGCHGAEREGSAPTGSEWRNAPLPLFRPEIVFNLTALTAAFQGGGSRLLFLLTAPGRLCSGLYRDCRRRWSRAWYFHKRRSVCRRRLSQIANAPSLNS